MNIVSKRVLIVQTECYNKTQNTKVPIACGREGGAENN